MGNLYRTGADGQGEEQHTQPKLRCSLLVPEDTTHQEGQVNRPDNPDWGTLDITLARP